MVTLFSVCTGVLASLVPMYSRTIIHEADETFNGVASRVVALELACEKIYLAPALVSDMRVFLCL